MEKSIYFIVNGNFPSNIPDGEYEIINPKGIAGTCFFIDDKTFYTAHHVLNEEISFTTNSPDKRTKIFLFNSNGHIINDPKITKSFPNKDICIGTTNDKPEAFIQTYLTSKSVNDTYVNTGATYYGCPIEKTKNLRFKVRVIANQVEVIEVLTKITLEKGDTKIFMLHDVTDYKSLDGYMINNHKVVFFKDQITLGFSGGPFISADGNILGINSQSEVGLSSDSIKKVFVSMAVTIPDL